MLEEIALSISTAIFFICTLFVSAVLPSPPTDVGTPHETVKYVNTEENSVLFVSAAPFDIAGEWSCQGKTVSFTRDGKMTVGEHTLNYRLAGGTLTLGTNINGEERVYSMKLDIVDSRTMKLNGVPFFKVK